MNVTSNCKWIIYDLLLVVVLFLILSTFAFNWWKTINSTFLVLIFIIFLLVVIFLLKCNNKESTFNNNLAVLAVTLSIIIMIVSGYYVKTPNNWILVILSMLSIIMAVGALVNGRLAGVLIDERNQMSLSRLQIILWTMLILSGFFTIALARIAAKTQDPLNIAMDVNLWVLMGISTTSLVGSPLLLSLKEDKEPTGGEKRRLSQKLELRNDLSVVNVGMVPRKAKPDDAEFADMFRGDETATLLSVNMAKVQMFLFTIIAVFAYAASLYLFMANQNNILMNSIIDETTGIQGITLPILNTALIAIIGISHAGYLTNKATDQTKTIDKPIEKSSEGC